MMFCITYLDLNVPLATGYHVRKHILNASGTGPLLFDSQDKAHKWIAKWSMDHIDYSVDPYHDLEGSLGEPAYAWDD